MSLAVQRRALQVVEEALDLETLEREAFIAEACGDDADLAAAVRRLLEADSFASDLLPTEPPEPVTFADLPPPPRVGPYRLGPLLGRGGMGEVFLGERDDGVFEQTVAVKLLRPSLFPTASERYFVSERRLLASLRHPGIARIIDGGVEPGGRPYFIMERVDGQPIDEFVQAHGLGPRQIAALVGRLCRAVQHAHGALVVHADIKPSNVLVEADGEPRLLDFGIAVLAGDEAGEDGAFPVTPAYASPQRLAGARPTTSDDIFALGVLLRTLLAGHDAPRDLAAIVARATAAEPAARYAAAAAFADDLDRWAAHQPVSARPATAAYVFSRFVRRRRWLVGAMAAAFVLLIGATATISVLYVQAQEAHAEAETRFTDTRHMARYLLFDVYDRLAQTPQSLAIRGDVARVGQNYLVALSQDSRASLAVRLEAIEGLVRLATLQSSQTRGLGRLADARANLARAAGLAAALVEANPSNADVALAAARVRLAQSTLELYAGNSTAAPERTVALAAERLAAARRLRPDHPALAGVGMDVSLLRAQLREAQGRYAEAVAEARAALAAWQALPPVQAQAPEMLRQAARAQDALAEATYYGGDPAGAEAPYRAQLATYQRLLAAHPTDPDIRHGLARSYWALGATLLQLERNGEGLPLLQAGLALAERNAAFDASDATARRDVRILQNAVGQAFTGLRRFDEAIAVLRQAVEDRRQAYEASGRAPQAQRDHAVGVASLADAYLAAGRRPEACDSYRQASGILADMRRRGVLPVADREYTVRLVTQALPRACA
jgi:serine/threonine-protein kinase